MHDSNMFRFDDGFTVSIFVEPAQNIFRPLPVPAAAAYSSTTIYYEYVRTRVLVLMYNVQRVLRTIVVHTT